MSTNDILSYLFTAISFFSVVFAIFRDETTIFACVLIIFSALSFAFLLIYLRSTQNKEYTLQILSKENRISSTRLLLTYNLLVQTKDKFTEKFCAPKLRFEKASFRYDIAKAAEPDANCVNLKFKFKLNLVKYKRTPKVFDILITHPPVQQIDSIAYSFSGDKSIYHSKVRKIRLLGSNTELSTFCKTNILFNGKTDIETLTVSYIIPGVYRIDKEHISGAIIACPFIYARRIDRIEFALNYPEDVPYRPNAVCLKLYPYNGMRFTPQSLMNFKSENNFSLWTTPTVRCTTRAVYIIETHNAISN